MPCPRRPLAVLAVLAACLMVVGSTAAPATAADVIGDDEADRYVGTGGLILPGGAPDEQRREVAGCRDCAWRLTTPCIEPALGTPFAGQPGCGSVVRGCPSGELLRAWFRGQGEGWRELGLVCLGPGGPRTVDDTARQVRDRVVQAVEPLVPQAQPARGLLAQLPVVFTTGQSGGEHRWRMSVAGTSVDISASPHWRWRFGDGAALYTDDPGRPHPHSTVRHAYRTAGVREVAVRTEWSARFTVSGLGPFAVDEPVVQQATLVIGIGEGRAVLAPGPVAQ